MRMQQGTGTLWRIRRTTGPRGARPPEPLSLPFYAFQLFLWIVGAIAGLLLGGWALRRLLQRTRT